MAAVIKTNRPGPMVRMVLEEARRVHKHQNENFERLSQHWSPLPDGYTTFTHGTLLEVPNPWYPALPTGFQPIAATDSTGAPVATPSYWTINPTQRAGFVGLTLYFN